MGVRGLTTYINHNQDIFMRQHLLHDCYLVIDGFSLCSQLYRTLNGFSAFGGDYDKFVAHTRNFFKNLQKCKVTSLVLFDGSYEVKKLKTAYSRLRSKINGASKLDPITQDSLQIFPYLLRSVFKEALKDMNVAFTICEYEADDEIAALARYLNCPVLSYDSDFFIYNVLYIPFNTLDIKPKPIEKDGTKFYAIQCKLYTVQHLCDHFGGLKEELLPLLATLLGNDYVEKRVFSKFFSQLKLQKSRKRQNDQQRCIHTMFNWLKNENLDTAIEKIIGRLKKHRKNKVKEIIKKSVESYNSNYCRSLIFFDLPDESISKEVEETSCDLPTSSNDEIFETDTQGDGEDDLNDKDDESESSESEESSSIDDSDEHGMPDWFSDGIRQHLIPPCYLNIYTLHLHFCSPQAEDYSDEDSFLCALPILRYAFDLMTNFSQEGFTYVMREGNNRYKRILIDQEYATERLIEAPFYELSEEQLKSCFTHFLNKHFTGLDMSDIDLLPTNFQLYMISILWWVAKCEVPLTHVHSLILCYIVLEVIDEKTGTFRGHNHFNNKYSKKIEELKRRPANVNDELLLNKNKVLYEDCLLAASALIKHFEIDTSIKKKPKSYNVKRMHSFAQFQCCLGQMNNLNKLCRNTFENTIYSKSYSGVFVYNIALKLENENDPSQFIEQYLKGASTVLIFYRSICKIFNRLIQKMNLQTKEWIPKSKTRHGRRKKKAELDDINFIVKGFESEVVI